MLELIEMMWTFTPLEIKVIILGGLSFLLILKWKEKYVKEEN